MLSADEISNSRTNPYLDGMYSDLSSCLRGTRRFPRSLCSLVPGRESVIPSPFGQGERKAFSRKTSANLTSEITIAEMANNKTMYTEGKAIEIAQSVGIMPKNLGGKRNLG